MSNDPMFYAEPTKGPSVPEKKSRGCFFWGCITLIILFVVGAIAVVTGGYFLYRYGVNTLKEYSEPAPMAMPPVTMPEAEREQLHQRVDAFREAVNAGKPAEPIVLTAEDLNAMIDDNPDMKGKAHVSIDGSKIKADISFPLGALNLSKELVGRYINGTAVLRVSLINDVLDVRMDSIEVKGKDLPPQFKTSLTNQNLAEEYMKEEKNREMIRKISSLEVKDGKVILTPRSIKAADTPKGEEPKAEEPKAADAPEKAEPPKAAEPPPKDQETPKSQARRAERRESRPVLA